MVYNSDRSILWGFFFGIGPGVLISAVGLALGGEWAWTLGFIGLWLIVIGLFAGPVLGNVGPEILTERPAVSGSVVGAIPGVVLTVVLIEDNFWVGVLAVVVGSILGASVGHWVSKRHSTPENVIPVSPEELQVCQDLEELKRGGKGDAFPGGFG